jgi:hypothetical protein
VGAAGRSFEKLRIEIGLKLLDEIGHRRLTDVKTTRGRDQGSEARDGFEGTQTSQFRKMVELHTKPSRLIFDDWQDSFDEQNPANCAHLIVKSNMAILKAYGEV